MNIGLPIADTVENRSLQPPSVLKMLVTLCTLESKVGGWLAGSIDVICFDHLDSS